MNAKKPPQKKAKRKSGHELKLRPLKRKDYPGIKRIMDIVYPSLDGAWTREQYQSQISRFPEGQFCITDRGRVVAAAFGILVDYARYGDQHTYDQITGDGYFTTHDPAGDTLYGVDMFVDPGYRDLRLGRRLYDARKELCRNLNLKSMIIGGRIPGYDAHADALTPRAYVEQVQRKEIRDPVLSFQLANDFHVRSIVRGYAPKDVETRGFAVILEWINLDREEPDVPLIGAEKTVVRVGAVQWQMRTVTGIEDLMNDVEYFVDAVAGYKADFVLFPELFNAPLLAGYNQADPAGAMRELAGFTDALRDFMTKLAVSYNINIIAGSIPEYRDGTLSNVSYLCRRDGTTDAQYKLHVTPDEKAFWGFQGGDGLQVFDTDVGKVGVLVCYDVEFPELPRLMAESGMSILFVPYWTDTKNAYLRVRRCAQARAIENECYVVITGSVGNLPRVENMDVQYSQSAIFTPSDFAFPHDAVAAEATPNTETTLIADLDLGKLRQMRHSGSVRNFLDRRTDLYRLSWHARPRAAARIGA
ncbi:MAG: GNAT family N-acetyltransferase [Alphaproteobacteria bacterium]|nr:GNAT family N-acetyltransferase [Alphaproteobacteria bacterium]